jgi:hypothetical protein
VSCRPFFYDFCNPAPHPAAIAFMECADIRPDAALAGLTGSVLAWRHELDAILNPALMHVQPPPTKQWLRSALSGSRIAWLSQQSGYGPPSMVSLPLHA